MKDMIVLCAVLPLTLAILLFIGYVQDNSRTENMIRETAYSAVENVKQEGCFTAAITDDLKTELAELAGVDKSEIKIIADSTPKYRTSDFDSREMISYEIIVPIKKVVPMPKLFGIKDEENTSKIQIKGLVASERLAP